MKKTHAPKPARPSENKREKPARFLKASRAPDTPEHFTLEHVAKNMANGVLTNFIPDANVILRIQAATDPKFPATDTTLAHFGLLELVDTIRQCIRNRWAFSVSPIFAFSELPEQGAALALQRYYAFGQRFGIDWEDDPQSSTYDVFGRKGAASIWSATEEQRAFLGLNYAYQLLMLVIRHTGATRTPIENFTLYLNEVLKLVPIMSMRDLAVAMYLFADPRHCREELKSECANIRKNFGKHDGVEPLTLEAMDACALNSAYDMQIANFANLLDTKGSQGTKIDNWIVTGDEKLCQFMDLCHNVHTPGLGAGFRIEIKSQTSADGYFQQAQALIKVTVLERRITQPKLPGPNDVEAILRGVWDSSVKLLAATPDQPNAARRATCR